jgi:hypothetical protein
VDRWEKSAEKNASFPVRGNRIIKTYTARGQIDIRLIVKIELLWYFMPENIAVDHSERSGRMIALWNPAKK